MQTYPIFRDRIALAILSFLFIPFTLLAQSDVLVERNVTLMGSQFQITIVAKDSSTANQHIDLTIAEIERIENLISEWRPYTQVSEVNRNAGIKPVKVDKELFDLTHRALEYSKISNGAFDISTAAMDKVWKFDGSMTEKPSEEIIQKSIEKVGYEHIILDSVQSTIFLAKEGMKIGFGSIGKGYAADKGRELMQTLGIKSGIVNASGDIATWGKQPNGKPWRIGINNPFSKKSIAKILKLKNSAVATSGSYEKYVEIDGKRYAHIINPKTGYPSTGLTSVTIYGPSAEFANALSTSIMVLGEKEGKKLAKKYPKYNFLFITDKGKIIKK
ncbi:MULTISPECIES: FAD:protein FMN transferase [Sphingobacterium]|uniref:FAD:protein FMN transferase n=1 Tax=Sphingobacterium litopenaei TaxID=2763500 RepID=A0ABR7YHE7_9SPHI|nr:MULTISPECIES: FAD:protein FMN transferase [Sphingobacterium]MBD1430751.1 FAD:protein FMN transferase [Sphingobacterium litopenaei]NGM74054.1 FAD:protein FMN transferase [Sphingobacterium sp. SGL-16]